MQWRCEQIHSSLLLNKNEINKIGDNRGRKLQRGEKDRIKRYLPDLLHLKIAIHNFSVLPIYEQEY